jgi:Lon protease-like protein
MMHKSRLIETLEQMPDHLPLFPLAGALMLPRGQMPLNIFEPRYLDMVDAALRGNRLIGMIQPVDDQNEDGKHPLLFPVGCVGRISQFVEAEGDRYIITLTGLCRFRLVEEKTVRTPFRQAVVSYEDFAVDFEARKGEEAVDRADLLRTLKAYVEAEQLEINWREVNAAPTEALVNALSKMCPFGTREKQALLEAHDLAARAAILVAMTEIELARRDDGSATGLQ